MKVKTLRRAAAALLASLLVVACQDIFTFSPFSFLQRDPDRMSMEQKLVWAEEALASGDMQAIEDAYAAIDDAALASTDPELNYLAASLAMELSGVPDLLFEVLGEDIDFGAVDIKDDLDEFLLSVQASYVADAAGFFAAASDGDPALLSGTDYILGTACLLFAAAVDPTNGTVTALDSIDVESALNFVEDGLMVIDPDDSSYELLNELRDLLNNEF